MSATENSGVDYGKGSKEETCYLTPSVQAEGQGPCLKYSMLVMNDETLQSLKKEKESLQKENELLKKENEALRQQLASTHSGHGGRPLKPNGERSNHRASELEDVKRRETMDSSGEIPVFLSVNNVQLPVKDSNNDIEFIEGPDVVPQEASCGCNGPCTTLSTDHVNEVQVLNKHQMYLNSTSSDDLKNNCTSIVPYFKPAPNLNGDGVALALLGPPCKTDAVPPDRIITSHALIAATQKLGGESMLMEWAHKNAGGVKFIQCRTTSDGCNKHVDPGVTAAALRWLINNWEKWKSCHDVHTLIVCILYGGKYRQDEEEAVNEASFFGLNIVAAAGCKSSGITFPAKLGAVLSVGALLCDGTLAPYSPAPTCRELDVVACGSARLGNFSLVGTSVSAVSFATDLAKLYQRLYQTNPALIKMRLTSPYVLRELLEHQAGGEVVTGQHVMNIIRCHPSDVKCIVEHMLIRRDRKAIGSGLLPNDASSNTKNWSSKSINDQYQKQQLKFPPLNGTNITIAIIDTFMPAFLNHLKDHKVQVNWKVGGVGYFSFNASMLSKHCCSKYIRMKGGHGLQCAAIIANTAPNCNFLMVIHDDGDEGEKMALSIVMEKDPDILLLSSVTTDYIDMKYLENICPHLSRRVVICAAGNEGKRDRGSTICYPPRARDVITIGACDGHGDRCSYSSIGGSLDFLCPGQFSVADESGAGGTCYSASAAAAICALVLEYIDTKLPMAQVPVWVGGQWTEEKIPKLARSTHLMRTLLSSRLCHSTEHDNNEGYGMLLIENLVLLTPDGIKQEVAAFHSDVK